MTDKDFIDEDEPVHEMFGLSRSSYLVLHRAILEAMPVDWQHRFVRLMADIEAEFDTTRFHTNFLVEAVDEHDEQVDDPMSEYRRPDRNLIDSLRRQAGIS